MPGAFQGLRLRIAAGLGVLAIVPPVFASPWELGFTDVTTSAGVEVIDVTYGLGWADFDQDDALDLFLCRHYFRPVAYHNLADGTFTDNFFPPLFEAQDHHGPLLADLDGDGDLDIYLTGGADAGASSVSKLLYRNDGDFSFTEVGLAWGVADSLARGRSSSAIDVDADGDVDFFVAKAPRIASPNSLFLNDGTPSFTDVAASAGIADDFGSVGGLWGDYDRDGDPDLLIGGEEQSSFLTVLYRNEGNVTFTDVTASVLPGIGQIAGADWGDYDGDGDLDLAVGLGDAGLFDAVNSGPDSISFFFNMRNGDNGLDALAFTQTGDSASYDLYYNAFYIPDRIWISADAHHPGPITPFSLGDDEFGAPPFLPGIDTGFYLWVQQLFPVWELRVSAPPAEGSGFSGVITTTGTFTAVVTHENEPYTEQGPRGARLWRNDGGTFVDVSAAAGLVDTTNVRSVSWVDLDQDGVLDLHVLVKGDSQDWNRPDLFYQGQGDGTFEDVAQAWGLEGPPNGLGDAAVFGDYDSDGDLDLATTSGTGPRFFARAETLRLYRNEGPVGNWLEVDLEGVVSCRPGYGAWITCVTGGIGPQTRYVTGNAWRGETDSEHPRFGLANHAMVDTLRVEWPSGTVDLLTGVAANQRLTVVEGGHPSDAPGLSEAPRVALALASDPNPFSDEIVLRLTGRGPRPARLEIFDPGGRRVLSRPLAADETRVRWDGRDSGGRRVGSGVYFVRVREGDRSATAKVVRIAP
jgi:hypothetical protein